jgi:uncharacterized membrane protein
VALSLLSVVACKDDDGAGDDAAGASTGTTAGEVSTGAAVETAADSSGGAAGDTEATVNSLDDRPCPDDSFLTWENFGAMYVLNYCTGCHSSGLPADQRQGAPTEVNFDDLSDVRTWAASIWLRSGDDNETMPPFGIASADERHMLGEWLACGAPTDADLGQ